MFYTYILQSEKTGMFYRGMTNDLVRRFKEHNNSEEKFTKQGVPWRLVWYATKSTRSEAMKLEVKIKNIKSRKRLMSFMKKYPCVGGTDVPPVEEVWMKTML